MSRARSARGASPARNAGRGQAAGRPGVFVQSPKSDVYVGLLAVALGAMLLGCLLLVLVLQKYDFKIKAASNASPPPSTLVASIDDVAPILPIA